MKYTKVVIQEAERIEATKWARNQFGRPKGESEDLRWSELIWYVQQLKVGAGFYFRKPEDAFVFLLRWS